MDFTQITEATNETTQELHDIFIANVGGKLRHPYYDKAEEIAEKATAYTTGEGLDVYLKQFNRRENEVMFEQRVQITQQIISAVINNITFVLNKISRSSAVKLIYTSENETKLEALKEIDSRYHARKDAKAYYSDKARIWDATDPNMWIIQEFTSTDGSEYAHVYPFLVGADDALNFEYINGNLNWLVIEQDVVLQMDNKTMEVEQYTIYSPLQNMTLMPIHNPSILGRLQNGFSITLDGVEYWRFDNILYQLIIPMPHNIGWTPARRCGYKIWGKEDEAPYVPFWWDAEPWLSKLIKANSEMDLTTALHAFPQKIQYEKCCPNKDCIRGQLVNGGTCQTCHGTGLLPHTSAQDIILIQLPTTKDEMIDLNSLIAYIYPPVDGLNFQHDYIKYLIQQAIISVFNSDIFARQEVAQTDTATGKLLDYQSIYDTIYPYARNYADGWKFCIETMAKITDTNEGLTVIAVVEKDFRFKTINELMAELQTAKNAGADETILREIQREIIAAMYDERPTDKLIHDVKDKWNPFSGKTREEILSLMNGGNVPKRVKVFYANFGYIFDELARVEPQFYVLSPERQKDLIDAKVNEIMKQLSAEMPALDTNNLFQ